MAVTKPAIFVAPVSGGLRSSWATRSSSCSGPPAECAILGSASHDGIVVLRGFLGVACNDVARALFRYGVPAVRVHNARHRSLCRAENVRVASYLDRIDGDRSRI